MRGSVAAPARFHYGLGAVLSFWGWPAGAAQAYRDATRADPGFADAHFRLGESLALRGDWDGASRAFGEAARLRPCSLEAQGNLALALARAGRRDPAAEALERLAALRPDEGELHVLRGAYLRQIGRPAEAIRAFRRAARLRASPGWRRFHLGEALLGAREWQRAQLCFLEARQLVGIEPEPGLLAARASALNTCPSDPPARPRRARGTAPRRLLEAARAALAGAAALGGAVLAPPRPAPRREGRWRPAAAPVGVLVVARRGAT